MEQVAAILATQTRLRDRSLFALLAGTGMRVGQALGLRHSDVVSQERRIEIVAREDNANRARGKRGRGWVPITSELVRLHSDYMHEEYGDLDSDYVFVNLWGGRVGHAMTYQGVHEVVLRTGRIVGFDFTRISSGTPTRRWCGAAGCRSRSSPSCCHRSAQTKRHPYLDASPEDLRAELEHAGRARSTWSADVTAAKAVALPERDARCRKLGGVA